MGIMDNMLHSESLGFVSPGNCNQSDGKSGGGQPIENGTQSINLEPLRMPSSEALKALNDKMMVESVKPLEHQNVDLSNDPLKILVTSAVEETVWHKYPPRRRISAVRDFPSFCGRNAPPLHKDGCTQVVASIENKSLVHEKPGMEARPTKEMMKTDLVQMLDKFQDGDVQLIRLQRSLSKHIVDKVPVAQEKKNHNEFEASSDNVMKECQEKLQHTVVSLIEDIQQNYGLVTDEDPKSSRFHIAPLEEDQRNQAAAFMEESPDRTLSSLSECKTQMSEEDFECFDFTSETGVVQGLMAAQSCPWRHGKAHCKSKGLVGGTAGMKAGEDSKCFDFTSEKGVVQGLMAAQSCPWRQGKANCKSKSLVGGTAGMKTNKNGLSHKPKNLASDAAKSEVMRNVSGFTDQAKSFSWKKNDVINIRVNSGTRTSSQTGIAFKGTEQMDALNKEDCQEHDGANDNFLLFRRPSNFSVSLSPSRPTNLSSEGDANDSMVTRSKVRETLCMFHTICRKLLQAKESKQGNAPRRVDLHAAKMLKEKGRYVNVKKIIGSVPGVEVGDKFQYRVELNVIGLHHQIKGGIDYIKRGKRILATTIVASGGYDDMEDKDVLVYTGSGGNIMGGDKQPEDQKLEQGILALKNSVDEKNPVRVVRGDTKVGDGGKAWTYIYDGLYVVEKWWQEMGQHGTLDFKFRLVRKPGQPQLAWQVVKKSKKFKVREGLCVPDISHGKEVIPICAVNTLDNEKPPAFQYITHMINLDLIRPSPPKGCGCTNGCTDSRKCACVIKNGGEIPFNHNGAIVEAKSLVYECGPACKCPPSCHNRVSQNGIKFHLEIFKTESRGWGVRSLNSIPSGSFICEYLGELLEEKEADQRTGNDEYLFDIGNQYDEGSLGGELSTLMPEAHLSSHEVVEGSIFTIDAASFGNIGRLVNHSCSPNLYAQNVLYDHEDKRIPHIMLFAAEHIPPLQELTYHYNYVIDQVLDSDGNIKKKNCYCGSSECTGRLY